MNREMKIDNYLLTITHLVPDCMVWIMRTALEMAFRALDKQPLLASGVINSSIEGGFVTCQIINR